MSDGFGGGDMGAGMMQDARAKMDMQIREDEARRNRKPERYPPPPRDGIFKRMIRRIRGGRAS